MVDADQPNGDQISVEQAGATPRGRAAQEAARRAASARERSSVAVKRATKVPSPSVRTVRKLKTSQRPAPPGGFAGARGRGARTVLVSDQVSDQGTDLDRRAQLFNQRLHPLTDASANARLFDYESRVKESFDRIVPVLKEVAAMQCEPRFEERALELIRAELGYELPREEITNAWVSGLDMRRLFAMSVFKTYRRISDEFYTHDPLRGRDQQGFDAFLQGCGFHLLDVTPCADGRLAHAISYVLRLPYAGVRRKSYAGSLFDVENTVQKWAETELMRFREGRPNTADAPTRYLKTVMYHFSSVDPSHQGCAAHGSDDELAARAGLERLQAFQQAIENTYCCGASVDLLLIGLDTDTDAIRVHVPDRDSHIDLTRWVDGQKLYEMTRGMAPEQARGHILELVRAHAAEHSRACGGESPAEGMLRLIARLIENNMSQIDYVRVYHQGGYADIGHAERFIGAGIGFEEIQLRNLTYFAYLATVEEGAADMDVGIKIFSGLNVSRGLPVPVIVRYDYHGGVPGARERAIEHCERIAGALKARYPKLCADGLLHCLRAVRDCDAGAPIEVVGCSLQSQSAAAH
ncbi:carboxysome shell carbonic anhydrase [Thiorhodovibrio winogradskyi]|uniref:Carboxysome shell carbonic anhydrase n=1 Tax=Thiorhodovibrio winogradskyi TaxID=77007 RepID=A0ABZ0S836_9GAMM